MTNFPRSPGPGRAIAEEARTPQRYDALEYLPCSRIEAFRPGQTIYGAENPPDHLYLVIDGRVKLSLPAEEERHVIVAICGTDDFFGESAFLNLGKRSENATAIDATKLMSWSGADVEALIMKQPELGIALVQNSAARVQEFAGRIESFSLDTIGRRVARSILILATRLGREEAGGWTSMGPMTHELMAQYAGTSREIVTHYMNRLRRAGALSYSRKAIRVHLNMLRDWIRRGDSRESRRGAPAPVEPASAR